MARKQLPVIFLVVLACVFAGAQETPDTQPRLDSFALSKGSFQFRVLGGTNRTYQIQASTDLLSWSVISTNRQTNGSFLVIDPRASNYPSRFYRAIASPDIAPRFDKWSLWQTSTQLRGANIYQRRVYPELEGTEPLGPGPVGPPYSQSDLDRLSSFGANYVNVSHPGLFTENPPYRLDTNIQSNLDSLLEMIAKADMFAVISFRTGPGRSEFTFFREDAGTWFPTNYLNDAVWRNSDAQDGWVAMWRYAAERYRSNKVVFGFDLMVEPNADAVWVGLDDPATFYPGHANSLYDWNPLATRISKAVREVDPGTPLLIAAMGWSAVNWLAYLKPTGDPRTVYTVHQYAPSQYTHQTPPLQITYPGMFDADFDGVNDRIDSVWLDTLLAQINQFKMAHRSPVAVNEFGVMRWEPGGAQFIADQIEWFERQGLNHAVWLWSSSWAGDQTDDDFNFRHGPQPTNHVDVTSSDLLQVLIDNWRRNTVRPSKLNFAETPLKN